jgi:polyisoprenoid-binding protein YceI
VGRARIAAAVVVVVLAVGGVGLWYFVLRDTAEPEASVDAVGGSSGGAAASGAGPATPDGEWAVSPDESVFVGYRVQETFAGSVAERTATGRTPAVEGTMTVEGDAITAASVSADVSRLESDQDRRDSALRTRGLETDRFPDAAFELTGPVTLPAAPARGETVAVTATGELTLHGVTAPVEVELEAQWDGPTISVAGAAPIAFADFGMEPIEIAGFVSTEDSGTMELQLLFVPA